MEPAAEIEAAIEWFEAAVALGDTGKLSELLSIFERKLPGAIPPLTHAQLARFRARLAALRGDADAAEAGFKRAAGTVPRACRPVLARGVAARAG